MPTATQYQSYLQLVAQPDKINKLCKLEFLNDDGTVAFVIDNNYKRGYGGFTPRTPALLLKRVLSAWLQYGKGRDAKILF
mgnify:CR=1 FL=1